MMRGAGSRLRGRLLLLLVVAVPSAVTAINVEVSEVLNVSQATVLGHLTTAATAGRSQRERRGHDAIDSSCKRGDCIGILTRDGSMDLDSRYGCTQPAAETEGSAERNFASCGVTYSIAASSSEKSTIATVKIAFHPDSVRKVRVFVGNELVVDGWEGLPGTSELQEIPGLGGYEGMELTIQGIQRDGDYLGIVEVEIFLVVDEVETAGVSASTRTTISATATMDSKAAMNTLDGDVSEASSWSCSSSRGCEITYDLQAVESLEQLRIAFPETSDVGGKIDVLAAGENDVFSPIQANVEAGGRPVGSDGLQTFGGVRALARYVKIVAMPSIGGKVVISEVEFRVGKDAPVRPVGKDQWTEPARKLQIEVDNEEGPVAERQWLKATGPLPLGDASSWSADCDSSGNFDGCHIFYIKDGDLDTRWTCGPADGNCEVDFDLNMFRYVRQIQFAFYLGDEQYNEFNVEAYTYSQGWVTVVSSAITSGNTTDYQTFNVGVHASYIRLMPVFQTADQTISIKEMIILEKRKNAFVEGTVPVIEGEHINDDVYESDVPTRFEFDIFEVGDDAFFYIPYSTVSAVRLRFPDFWTFVFDVSCRRYLDGEWSDFTERFSTDDAEVTVFDNLKMFTLSEPVDTEGISIVAAEAPSRLVSKFGYPTLRVKDFQVIGEAIKETGYFNMASTAISEWNGIPDIIGTGAAAQQKIMTAICETKGATFDGTDCVGELNDSTVWIELPVGEFYLDGPVFIKSGVTLSGTWDPDDGSWTVFVLYDGDHNTSSGEDAVVVIDGATDALVEYINFQRREEATGPIVPGTVGNLCLEVRDSQVLEFKEMEFRTCRAGAARFTDSSKITTFIFWDSEHETGNYLELTRVDDFYLRAFPEMTGLSIEDCNNIEFDGILDGLEIPDAGLLPPAGGDQTASVVITGDSSGIVFREFVMGPGAEPRILMESTTPLTLDYVDGYQEAVSGDCIVQVPEGSTEDSLVQLNSDETLIKSGNCWVLP